MAKYFFLFELWEIQYKIKTTVCFALFVCFFSFMLWELKKTTYLPILECPWEGGLTPGDEGQR